MEAFIWFLTTDPEYKISLQTAPPGVQYTQTTATVKSIYSKYLLVKQEQSSEAAESWEGYFLAIVFFFLIYTKITRF